MPADIIHDVEKGVAALVDAASGRALGPVAVGEDAVGALNHLLDVLPADPAEMVRDELMHWWGRIEAALALPLTAAEQPAAAAPPQAPPAPAEPVAADTAGETVRASAPDPQAAPQSAPAPPPPPADPAPVAPQPATAGVVGPVPAVPTGNERICPTCDGFRTVVADGAEQTCPACAGRGVVSTG